MCHPVLFEQYRRSLLDLFPTTIVTKVAPFEPVPTSEQVFVLSLPQGVDSFFFERLWIHEESRCQRHGTDRDFRLWLRRDLGTYLTGHTSPSGPWG